MKKRTIKKAKKETMSMNRGKTKRSICQDKVKGTTYYEEVRRWRETREEKIGEKDKKTRRMSRSGKREKEQILTWRSN